MKKEEYLVLDKDVKNLLEEFLLVSSYGVVGLVDDVTKTICNSITEGKIRMDKLLQAIEKDYPQRTPQRASIDGIAYNLFANAFQLYFIGNNAALFVELQGLLERVCLDKICTLLSVGKDVDPILFHAFSMKTLNDIADYFSQVNLWNKDDMNFAKRITTIRNGIAHKNVSLVSKKLGDGKNKTLKSIFDITNKTDMIPYIIRTLELLVKVSECMSPNIIKNPRFKARFEKYSKLFGSICNLHGEMLIDGTQRIPDVVKTVVLNRLYAPSILLASSELGDLLIEYKDRIVLYHRALIDEDDESVYSLHTYLVDLVDKIYEAMKKDLNIDADFDFFVKPEIATIEQIKKYLTQKINKKCNY